MKIGTECEMLSQLTKRVKVILGIFCNPELAEINHRRETSDSFDSFSVEVAETKIIMIFFFSLLFAHYESQSPVVRIRFSVVRIRFSSKKKRNPLLKKQKTSYLLFFAIKKSAMPSLNDLLGQASSVKLKPTATVVRGCDGNVKVERKELLSSSAAEAKIQASKLAGTKRGETKELATATRNPFDTTNDKIFPKTDGTLYDFNPDNGAWLEAERKMNDNDYSKLPTSIKIVTYNIWFDPHEWKKRTGALLDLVINVELADVVCLQGVTPKVMGRILQHEGVRNCYRVTDIGPCYKTLGSYGVVMMIRRSLPAPAIEWLSLPTTMGRSGLIANFGLGLALATVHLESLQSQEIRAKQLRIVRNHLTSKGASILLGDFNISATGPYGSMKEHESLKNMLEDYFDPWEVQHGNHGDDESSVDCLQHITFDSTNNAMLKQSKDVRNEPLDHSRLDRVMCKSAAAHSIRIIGNHPIGKNLFVSDHYGLAFEVMPHAACRMPHASFRSK